MSDTLSKLIQYFHDCYRSDNREQLIYDFLDKKVEDKVYIEGQEELLNGYFPIIPLDSEKAVSILKKLEVFKKEKELLYGAFFICGQYTDFKGDLKRLCAPLFYYPAEIEQREGLYYISIHYKERRINYPLVQLLSKGVEADIFSDTLFKELPEDYIEFKHIQSIVNISKKYFSTVDYEEVYAYPQNASLKSLKSKLRKLNKLGIGHHQLIPTSILGVVSKSSNTRGVLNELKDLSNTKAHALPLKSLFSGDQISYSPRAYRKTQLPMILSKAQQAILESSATQDLTMVVGPPGTGKTYTIGAIAIEHMSRGESVLIASRTDEAVDVIQEKIVGQLGIDRCVIRGSRKRAYATPLHRFLKTLLTRVNTQYYLLKEFGLPVGLNAYELNHQIDQLAYSVYKRTDLLKELEADFLEEVENEIEWGRHLSKSHKNLWDKLKTKYLNLKNKMQTPIWEYTDQIHDNDQKQISETLQLIHFRYVKQLVEVVEHHWNDIKNFREASILSSDTEKQAKFRQIDFNAILKAFPIWLTNLSEAKEVLPLEKEMFDVLIIDEATQCDIASCLPLIQRAKRVVFAGDPNQLRHVSFLSRGIQTVFAHKYGLQDLDAAILNYRDHSILDLALSAIKSKKQVAMLDEHYRSLQPIIAFSNQRFYDEGLRIMTARPDEKEQGVYFLSCSGQRDKLGFNVKEAEQILDNVQQQIEEEKALTKDYASSIGLLSPFRAQVDYLSKNLLEKFSIEEIEKHNIRVGTAYSFQGEERDVMHLSFAVDNKSHHSAFVHIDKPDVFNVSVTRARTRQYNYISVTQKDLKVDSLLHSYIAKAKQDVCVEHKASEYDHFLEALIETLKTWDLNQYWSPFPIAGLKIDILIKHKEQYIGIDLIGYPGAFEDSFGIERYRILNRAGVKVMPLPYSDWYFENEKTKQSLKAFLFSKV